MSDKPIIEIVGEFEIITEDAEIVANSNNALAKFLQSRRHMFERHEHSFAKRTSRTSWTELKKRKE